MTHYYDAAFDAPDVSLFLPLLASEANIIGPRSGSADVAGSDPARCYIAVRALAPVDVPAGAQITDPALATQLLGVWA